MLDATMSALLYIACVDAKAMCGVTMQFFAVTSGWSRSKGGSFSRTSIPAPAILSLFRASASATLSTTGPHAVLIKTASFFISAILSSLISFIVEALHGT